MFKRLGPLLRCCRFRSFLRGTYLENDPEEDDWLSLKADKNIIIHGVSLLGDDGGKFTVSVAIIDDDGDYQTEVSQTGTFTSGKRECSTGFYYGFDVILDEPIAVDKGTYVSVMYELSEDDPGFYIGNEVFEETDISGVAFDFNPSDERDVPQSRCAELLFSIKE